MNLKNITDARRKDKDTIEILEESVKTVRVNKTTLLAEKTRLEKDLEQVNKLLKLL